jgi:hypothetical protein
MHRKLTVDATFHDSGQFNHPCDDLHLNARKKFQLNPTLLIKFYQVLFYPGSC